MENFTPLGSQENIPSSTAVSTDGGEPTSSPILTLSGKHDGSRERKPPTITPRSFTRFFTPKSSLERGGRISASRQALRDITAQASNRRGRRTPTKDTVQIYDENLKGTAGATTRKKRKILDSVDATPERSSPLKRIRNQSLDLSEGDSDADQSESGDEVQKILQRNRRSPRRNQKTVDPILGSGYRSDLGRDLRREIGAYGRITRCRSLTNLGGTRDWQHETGNFHTRPEDLHLCHNVAMPSDHSIPFCTASCNSEYLKLTGSFIITLTFLQQIPLLRLEMKMVVSGCSKVRKMKSLGSRKPI